MPNVNCPSQGDDHGLPFILETFRKYGIKGTFFVETLSRVYFGDEPLKSLIRTILSAGQDVQLHIHPNWLIFGRGDWKQFAGHHNPSDACIGRSLPEMEEILKLGLEPFDDWDLPRPIAVRVGNFEVDRTVYRAMFRVGLRFSSNVGFAIFQPSDAALQVHNGCHLIDGTLEVPVLTYRQPVLGLLSRLHMLSVTGVGTAETAAVLRAARQHKLNPIVVLTHPFEFVKGGAAGTPTSRPNRINKERLISLCRLIAENPDQFRSVSFGESASSWLAESLSENRIVHGPMLPALRTLVENRANDLLSWL